jgi:uncharacterized membrane protein
VSDSGASKSRVVRTARLEAFSDGVFAIAITLLVLDIAVPVGAETDPLGKLAEQWPLYLAYLVSFATIGAIWLGHSAITECLTGADSTFMRINLMLLLVVSFLPFPTRLLGEFIRIEDAERVGVTIYGITLLAAVSMLSVLWRYAYNHDLLDTSIDQEDLDRLTERLTPGLISYGVLLALGLLLPVVTLYGYLILAVLFVLPFRIPRGRQHA